MNINFSKYHGCGNDFICIDARLLNISISELTLMSKTLCQRRFNIGADGIIALFKSNSSDFKMVIINSDGSIPEMCGNGLRCLAAFINDQTITNESSIIIETNAGNRNVNIISSTKSSKQISIDMGLALYGNKLPSSNFKFDTKQNIKIPYSIQGKEFTMTPISMGNPHAVIFVDDINAINIRDLGPISEQHKFFPNRVNTEFVQVISPHELRVKVWERGAGETYACGTGACAAVVAGILNKKCHNKTTVNLEGGKLVIDVDPISFQTIMEGSSSFVYSSSFNWNITP